MTAVDVESVRFEPTVLGAALRYRVMVGAVAVLSALLAVAFTLLEPANYRAAASITVPQQLSLQGQSADQYLDSQVLLLSSQDVAQRAVRIANGAAGGQPFDAGDFIADGAAMKVIPPENSSQGAYGGSIITVTFTWRDSRLAQTGANAVVQAFDDARTATIRAQGDATVVGIESAIADARSQNQRNDLYNQRTQAIVNQQIDAAHHPTIVWAGEPKVPINGNSKRGGAIGLLMGLGLGAALAFARASRRRVVHEPRNATAIYDAPFLADVPARSDRAGQPAHAGEPFLPVAQMPSAPTTEQFRFAASAIERLRADRKGRLSVAVISPRPGTGRTTTVANLALALSEGDVRVCVLDADVECGALTETLLPGCAVEAGLRQLLSGQSAAAECVRLSPLDERVAVLPSGPPTAHRVAGTALVRGMNELLDEATSDFDLVLVDTPAVMATAYALDVASVCDVVVVLVGLDDALTDHLELRGQLARLGKHPSGLVLNRGAAKQPRRRLFDRGRALAAAKAWPAIADVETDAATAANAQTTGDDVAREAAADQTEPSMAEAPR